MMRCRIAKQIGSVAMTVLAVLSNYVFASTSDPNDPNHVWIVALEKDSTHEVCSEWNPTLYKIGVEEAKVVEKKRISEQGAPAFCYSIGEKGIKVIIGQGVAANGTSVGEETTVCLKIGKNDMRVLKRDTKKGREDTQAYRKTVLSDEDRKLDTRTHREFTRKEGDVFLGTSKITPRAFMFTRFLKSHKDLSLEILDSNTLTSVKSIPLKVGNRKLGGFSGADWGDVTLISDRYVVCLFHGNSNLGTFAPGYVVIIDTKLEVVKYVAVGSNPARGIAH